MISLVVRANQSVLNYSEGFVGWLLQKPKAEFIKKIDSQLDVKTEVMYHLSSIIFKHTNLKECFQVEVTFRVIAYQIALTECGVRMVLSCRLSSV